MIEVYGNLWTLPADYRCITTNGSVKTNGCSVMGRGCAREAAIKYPDLAWELGQRVLMFGNKVHLFRAYDIISFPVKHQWHEKAALELIDKSISELIYISEPHMTYLLPKPGCGNGQLSWSEIRIMCNRLPDNIHIVDFEYNAKR